jgi:hypothetical protein
VAEIDIEIDDLTNSVVHERSGQEFSTKILRWSELNEQQKADLTRWRFAWSLEAAQPAKEVVALIVEGVDTVQGLMAIEPAEGYLHVALVESAPHNVGSNKVYRGVPANLFAFACLRSLALGFDGFVAFDAKTERIEHYKPSLGAVRIGRSSRMVIEAPRALSLVERYYKERDQWPL